MNEKTRTLLLGLAFLLFLGLSYIENILFFTTIGEILQNSFLAIVALFAHNALVISLIILGMSFYVNLVLLNFFKREKYASVIIEHPRTFAIVFTVLVIFLSILRGFSLLGGINIESLPRVILMSLPLGIIEGYGIYLAIHKTLGRTMALRDMLYIYGIFFAAAIIEVGAINLIHAS